MSPVTSVEEVSLKAMKVLTSTFMTFRKHFFIAVLLYRSLARTASNQLLIGLLISVPQHGRFSYAALT